MTNTVIDRLLFGPDSNRNWHMSFAERTALLHLLALAKPDVSIEIGTFMGGSLRPISRASRHVYTFDIDANQHRDISGFTNVTYVTGDSRVTLPPIIEELNDGSEEVNFVLVDGTHEACGVATDIVNCLRYSPKSRPTYILMHDSSNPAVRAGIQAVPWAANPHVHALDLDFVNGLLYDRADIHNQLWGGFALAVILPTTRTTDLEVTAYFEHSRHALLRYAGAT